MPRRKDAEALLRRVQQEIASGTYGKREENPTLSEFSRSFLEAKREELKLSPSRTTPRSSATTSSPSRAGYA